MTYGWVLLILGLVAVVLWQMGFFQPPAAPPACNGFSNVKPIDWKASGTNLTLTLVNEAGTKINVEEIDADIFGSTCSTGVLNEEIRPGGSYSVSISGCTEMPESGEYWNADLTIKYTNLASGIDHNSVGECHGSVED